MSHLKPGILLRERYTIAGLIGKGGMGAVYLADDNRLKGRRCAIKEQLVTDSSMARAVRNQFEQEASILARLDHPGLPKVSDYFFDEVDNRDYLVMDYVPGQNLEQVLKKAQREGEFLDEYTVLGWLNQLCDILAYLHSRNPMVLHRDIKPANIKLTPDNQVKLVDFGLAKPFDPDDPRTITGLQGLGSLPYTPLEQYVGYLGHTDARTDLYALGATAYHLLTGQIPASAHARFLDQSLFALPQTLNPHISLNLGNAILWAMELHPKDRADSIKSWREILDGGEKSAPTLTLPPDQGQTPQASTSWQAIFRENALLWGVAGLVLALALLLTLA